MNTGSYTSHLTYYIKRVFFLLVPIFYMIAGAYGAYGAEQKLHPIESYTVKYILEGNSKGEKIQYSKDWGRVLCWKEVSEITMPGVGTVKKNEKIITRVDDENQWIYTINLDDNTGTKMKNPMFAGIYASIQGRDPKEFSKEFMTSMGGKVIGEKVVNGEKCSEWEIPGGAKTCLTEDLITVESSVDIAGVSVRETAVDVKRNSSEPENICDPGSAQITETDIKDFMQE